MANSKSSKKRVKINERNRIENRHYKGVIKGNIKIYSGSLNEFLSERTNKSFIEVVRACAKVKRFGQNGSWITEGLMEAYKKLHEKGYAYSVEVWENFELVGGLYGIDLGNIFCGESMFTKTNNASKIAFIHLVRELSKNGYKLIDCQVPSAHLKSLGAEEISRQEFIKHLS